MDTASGDLSDCSRPGHIMIIRKRIQGEIAVDAVRPKAVERIRYLKIIMIHMAGIQALVALIVGGRIQRLRNRQAAVIAKHNFAQQPEIGAQTAPAAV